MASRSVTSRKNSGAGSGRFRDLRTKAVEAQMELFATLDLENIRDANEALKRENRVRERCAASRKARSLKQLQLLIHWDNVRDMAEARAARDRIRNRNLRMGAIRVKNVALEGRGVA